MRRGASYGGHLANWLQATTTRYKCLISHAGLVNLEAQWGTSDTIYSREVNLGGPPWEQGSVWRDQNPIRYAARFRTPALVTVGENDFRVPLNNSLEYWSALQRMQVPSRLIVFPDENHWILKGEDSRLFYAEVSAWLARWLAPAGRKGVEPDCLTSGISISRVSTTRSPPFLSISGSAPMCRSNRDPGCYGSGCSCRLPIPTDSRPAMKRPAQRDR
jgi:hypothetical protein